MTLIGKRRRQYIVIMSVYFFDVISTAIHIENPMQESMPIPRFFMLLVNNMYLGLIVHYFFLAVLYYLVINYLPFIISITEDFYHILFTLWFALDFGVGATSWFWGASLNLRIFFGGILYLLIDHYWVQQLET